MSKKDSKKLVDLLGDCPEGEDFLNELFEKSAGPQIEKKMDLVITVERTDIDSNITTSEIIYPPKLH